MPKFHEIVNKFDEISFHYLKTLKTEMLMTGIERYKRAETTESLKLKNLPSLF